MPFIRQTRDKRGFEHTYVMHVARPANGPPRSRVLYLFRTPGSLAVGRTALDAEVMEALEHTHPDLSFDWNSMTREAVVTRAEPSAPRPSQQRPQRGRPSGPPPRAAGPVAERIEDATLLGTTIGGRDAVRLRRLYHDVLHRIGRRARTPEDRESLLERAKKLDPDKWEDEAAIRAAAPSMEAECNRILAELPSRRRGRRGGRRRAEDSGDGPDRSVIMAQGDDPHESNNDSHVDPSAAVGAAGDDAGDRAADPETADPETDIPIDDGRRFD